MLGDGSGRWRRWEAYGSRRWEVVGPSDGGLAVLGAEGVIIISNNRGGEVLFHMNSANVSEIHPFYFVCVVFFGDP